MNKKTFAYAHGYNGRWDDRDLKYLTYEQFEPIYANSTSEYKNNNKPTGGLWLSEMTTFDNISKTRWLDYMGYKGIIGDYGFTIEFTKNAKICYIKNEKDLEHIYNLYPNKDVKKFGYLNYIDLACDYDAVYIESFINNSFESWSIPSLVVFNLKCIDSFIPFVISCDEYYSEYNECNNVIKEFYCKNKLKPSNHYLKAKEEIDYITKNIDLSYFMEDYYNNIDLFDEFVEKINNKTAIDPDLIRNILLTKGLNQYKEKRKNNLNSKKLLKSTKCPL